MITSDSHTKSLINDYEIIQRFNKIKFRTIESNLIEISSFGALSTNYKKDKDRYSFGFNYLLLSNTRTFILESESQIYFLPDSEYNAHFVIWNGIRKRGNWVDFEGIGDNYNVVKINDNKYEITFMNLPNKKGVVMNSIGGLNIVTENYQWYRGNYTHTFNNPVTSKSNQTFILNVSKLSGFVDKVNASFTYNGTARTVIQSIQDESVLFTSNFLIPEVEQTFDLEWIINITQNDSSVYNFSVSGQQSAFLSTLNITFLDEQNQTLITENVTGFLTLEQTRQGVTNTGSLQFGNLTLGDYFIQAESENYVRRGTFFTIDNQTMNLTLYLLKDIAGNTNIDYFIKTTSQRNIEDVRMTFQKSVNNTFITVAEVETDFAGQVRVFQDQSIEYRIILTHDDFPTKVITLIPLLTEYTIFIDEPVISLYNNVWEGIIYTLRPRLRVFNVSDDVEIKIDLFADDGSLEYFGIFIDGHSFTCIPASCVSNITGSPFGGIATVNITGTVEGTFDVHYFFKRGGFDVQFIHGDLYGFVLFQVLFGDNIANWLNQLIDGLGGSGDNSKIMLGIIAAIVTVVMVVVASQLGIAGISLVMIAVFGNLFFMLAGMIPKFTAIVTIIVGIFAYIILARE